MSSPSTETALAFENISKSFFGVRVLKDIHLELPAGHTLGLVGENGAGKSTLMNILGGNLRPDSGAMRLFGNEYAPASPRHATAAGVAFIHQELNLFSNLSIAENIHITAFPRRPWLPFIQRRQIRERTRQLLAQTGLTVSPDALVESLPAGERQLVEIAKALSIDARLMIFDEPTTSLTARETERLFNLIRRLQERGISIIYISHALADVMQMCDQIAVLRDGELVGRGPRPEFTVDRMISMMVGRSISQLFPERTTTPGTEVALELKQVSQPGIVKDISLRLRQGEVLGIAGLMGSGRSELARIIFGLDPFASGEILVQGKPLNRHDPKRSIRHGIAFITENRREEGLCMEASIADNIVLASLPAHASNSGRLISRAAVEGSVARMREAIKLNPTARNEQPVKTLSGGNQQKVVLAKWLLNTPGVFILDEPTRGIDVGAKYEVYSLINQLAAKGAGVLVISSEIEELIGLCDRILVMNRGQFTDSIDRTEFDRERILRAALHGSAPIEALAASAHGQSRAAKGGQSSP